MRARHRTENRLRIQRHQRPHIDDFAIHAVLGLQTFGGSQRAGNHQRQRHDSGIRTRTHDLRDAELIQNFAVRHFALYRVQRFVFKEDHGIGDLESPRPSSPPHRADSTRATTFKPGIIMHQFSTLWLCCAPKRADPPLPVRTTSGTFTCPLVM